MATSGTIGLTRISTAKLLEKAIRRVGLNPASLTAETVTTAQEDLFMLLLSLSNKGLNLWTVDHQIIALVPNQATYNLPVGTQDILNAVISTPSEVTGVTLSSSLNTVIDATFTSDTQKVTRFGVRFTEAISSISVASYASDLVTLLGTQTFTQSSGVMAVDQLYWYDLNPATEGKLLRFTLTTVLDPLTLPGVIFDTLEFDQGCSSIPITPFNRDDYTNQPRKTFTSPTITNYWFEKLVTPRVTFWPVPNSETKCVEIWRYRQVQDVGDLTEELEIPARWYEAITWHLALRLAFELPGIDPGRLQAVQQMAQGMVIEVEAGETDNAPTYFAPRIGVYTR